MAQDGHSPGTTIRRAPPDGAGPGETAPFAAGDIITAAEFEATFQGSRRLASGTIALQLSPAGDHFVVPESAVEKTPRHLDQQHLAVSFKQNLEGQLWESRLESAKDRQKTALAARRIGASDKMIGAFGVVGVIGGVALGSGLLAAGLAKFGTSAPALLAGGYALFDSDAANAPAPGDSTFSGKNPGQRALEAALFALPAGRLAAGGATMRQMMAWGGTSALGLQAVQDVGRGQRSPWNAYAGRGLTGALSWGLPMGPINAFASGARGAPLFANFGGYGLAAGLGLHGAQDLAAGQISEAGDYARSGALGLGLGLVGAGTVTGLDFVATMAVSQSNRMISASIPTKQSMSLEDLRRIFAQRPDRDGRLGQRWLDLRSSAFQGNLIARQGTANIGGGKESRQYTNVNPIMPGAGGPEKDISNHVRASFEQIEQVFQPGTVQHLMSRRLPALMVNWQQASQAAHRVMVPGGTIQLNVWSQAEETAAILKHLKDAGFRNVKLGGTIQGPIGPMEYPPIQSGTGVVITGTR